MKKKKDLEKSLRRYNIPFERCRNGYLLWGDTKPEDALSEREVWGLVNAYRYPHDNVNANVKESSNKRERAALRENIKKERFEKAELRDGLENPMWWN